MLDNVRTGSYITGMKHIPQTPNAVNMAVKAYSTIQQAAADAILVYDKNPLADLIIVVTPEAHAILLINYNDPAEMLALIKSGVLLPACRIDRNAAKHLAFMPQEPPTLTELRDVTTARLAMFPRPQFPSIMDLLGRNDDLTPQILKPEMLNPAKEISPNYKGQGGNHAI